MSLVSARGSLRGFYVSSSGLLSAVQLGGDVTFFGFVLICMVGVTYFLYFFIYSLVATVSANASGNYHAITFFVSSKGRGSKLLYFVVHHGVFKECYVGLLHCSEEWQSLWAYRVIHSGFCFRGPI